ncbi:tripartite tricarboxylate transporter TctB family protein [Nioella halotolerans]|uniref:tripartite tricarboxylate transporter TctB family protein n=1 Tax=Nioella halotolerans TaxID=2303578 RepID=UPI0026842630
MLDRDYRDIVAGLGLTLAGVAAAAYAGSNYAMGTVSRMGPGMMPVALGVTLAAFGLMISVPALFRKGDTVVLKPRPLVVMSISIIGFALMIETVGIVPAVFFTTVFATFSETRVRLGAALILGAGMTFATWALFIVGLNLPIPAFDWPF